MNRQTEMKNDAIDIIAIILMIFGLLLNAFYIASVWGLWFYMGPLALKVSATLWAIFAGIAIVKAWQYDRRRYHQKRSEELN